MKRILCACFVVSLLATAQAYEADIHFSTTYVLARAAGWPQADALTIASANEGVDENQDTVAALEMDTTPSFGYVTGSLHQAEKNLRFHCFSRTRGPAERVSADVRKVISGHFADVPERDSDPRSHASRLIALGAALHCQQDAYAHVDFGGSCGSYPGSCDGHTYQTLLDQVAFGLVKKHYFNPDHPGVSGRWLLEALQGSASELAARRPDAYARSIASHELVALSDALRGSGLELADDVRRDCNRYIAGKWLFEFFRATTQGIPDTLERLTPEAAATCRNAALASATIVRIPAPRYPRLNADASPWLVRADGSYQLAPGGDFDHAFPGIDASGIARLVSNYSVRNTRVQLSHWTQLLAFPLASRVALLSADSTAR